MILIFLTYQRGWRPFPHLAGTEADPPSTFWDHSMALIGRTWFRWNIAMKVTLDIRVLVTRSSMPGTPPLTSLPWRLSGAWPTPSRSLTRTRRQWRRPGLTRGCRARTLSSPCSSSSRGKCQGGRSDQNWDPRSASWIRLPGSSLRLSSMT